MNFLEPSPCELALARIRCVPRVWAAAFVALALLAGLQSFRLAAAERRTAELQRTRETIVARLQDEERRTAALRARMKLARAALDIRRTTALQAANIAAIGNALPPTVALASLRQDGEAWQLDGRGSYLEAVRNALVRLERATPRTRILDLRRDVRGEVVSFTIELDGT